MDEKTKVCCEGLDRRELWDESVKRALETVPRMRFVPPAQQEAALEDRAVPIGLGQTISQPFMVAYMTQEARISKGNRVLEIGTGSGYQAAVLAALGAEVFSVEIIDELRSRAEHVLTELGYISSVHIRRGDGWEGWPEQAPFDAILVTAASPRLPDKLVDQLKQGGRMVVPLELSKPGRERLYLFTKEAKRLRKKDLGPVRFVPLTGEVRAQGNE